MVQFVQKINDIFDFLLSIPLPAWLGSDENWINPSIFSFFFSLKPCLTEKFHRQIYNGWIFAAQPCTGMDKKNHFCISLREDFFKNKIWMNQTIWSTIYFFPTTLFSHNVIFFEPFPFRVGLIICKQKYVKKSFVLVFHRTQCRTSGFYFLYNKMSSCISCKHLCGMKKS